MFYSKRMSKYMKMKKKIKFTTFTTPSSLPKFFKTPEIPKTVQLPMRKIQLNVELTF